MAARATRRAATACAADGFLGFEVARHTRQRRAFAVLAHKWGAGAAAPDGIGDRKRVCVMLHGILGSKSNWNTPANRLLQKIGPRGWQVLQLDHRGHGKSPCAEPPHSISACASDVLETLAATGVDLGRDELVVCGHSFGGKVALNVLQLLVERGTPPKATWLFDSVPGALPAHTADAESRDSSSFVLGVVMAAAEEGPYADRAALLKSLGDRGLSKPVALWIAQSIKMVPGGVELSYCARTVREMYDSYRGLCMWGVVESEEGAVGVVVAGRNKHAWGAENLSRLQACQHVNVVTLEGAGHNVHVDDLPGLLSAILPSFE